jgi:hypothetical protein
MGKMKIAKKKPSEISHNHVAVGDEAVGNGIIKC